MYSMNNNESELNPAIGTELVTLKIPDPSGFMV
jgi:hypothetical protein